MEMIRNEFLRAGSETWFKNMAKTRSYEHKICIFIELSPARKTVIIIATRRVFNGEKSVKVVSLI